MEDVPFAHQTNDWIVKLTDVWGYSVQGQFSGANIQNVDKSHSKFKVYPNPTSDFLMLDLNKKTEYSCVEIYNLYGQLVLSETIDKNRIDIRKLNSGIYFITLNSKTIVFKKK